MTNDGMTIEDLTTERATSGSDTTATTEYAPEHTPRLAWTELAPEVYKAMVRLDAAARKGLDAKLLELVKIRASQINRCALCVDMHSKDALAAGESVERIVQLSAWEESGHFYTERELAALGAHRGGHRPDGGLRTGLGVRAGRRALRAGGAGAADRRDHGDQRVEPVRRDLPPGAGALPAGAAPVTGRGAGARDGSPGSASW
ncbi:AhpD family alkylhydroperoxidase [Streptomyces phaeoluteigriseus]